MHMGGLSCGVSGRAASPDFGGFIFDRLLFSRCLTPEHAQGEFEEKWIRTLDGMKFVYPMEPV